MGRKLMVNRRFAQPQHAPYRPLRRGVRVGLGVLGRRVAPGGVLADYPAINKRRIEDDSWQRGYIRH